MKINISIVFSLFMVLISSCKNEIPFDIKENPPKLVMNAFINADSLTNYLYLNFTGHGSPGHVKDASLEIRVNGELREKLRPMDKKETNHLSQCMFKLSRTFLPGDLVRIDARTDDGMHHAWVEVGVPKPMPQIREVETQHVALRHHGRIENCLRYKITLNDIPNERNFYRLIVDKRTEWVSWFENRNGWQWGNEGSKQKRSIITSIYHDYSYIFREDVVLTDGRPQSDAEEENGMFDNVSNVYGVFDDSRFENSSYVMTVYNDPEPQAYNGINNKLSCKVDAVIRVLSITETEYYYLRALNIVDSDAFDEVLNEAINYPSNVQGGTGLVSISTETHKTIRLFEENYD